MSDAAPLLTFERACIESGRVTTEPFSACGGTRFVALVGYFSPLFRLLRGDARLASGALRFAGKDAIVALRSGDVTLASFEAPPLTWTARRYLIESARLALFERGTAERRADTELERSGLVPIAKLRLCDVGEGWRRRVSLARAAVTNAPCVVVEAPLVDLDAATEEAVADALARLADERRLIVSFPAPPFGGRASELFEHADFTVVSTRGVVSYAGAPVPKS